MPKAPKACGRRSAIGWRRAKGMTTCSEHYVPRRRLDLRPAERLAFELQSLLQIGVAACEAVAGMCEAARSGLTTKRYRLTVTNIHVGRTHTHSAHSTQLSNLQLSTLSKHKHSFDLVLMMNT